MFDMNLKRGEGCWILGTLSLVRMQGRVTWPVCLSFAFLRSVINISGAALAGSCWSSSTSIAANKKPTPPPRFCERGLREGRLR